MGKVFSNELRNMIVQLHIEQGKPIKSLAEEHGVSVSSINGRVLYYYRNKVS